jgi:hypothetical protein
MVRTPQRLRSRFTFSSLWCHNSPSSTVASDGGFVVYTKINKTAALGVPASLIASIPPLVPTSQR